MRILIALFSIISVQLSAQSIEIVEDPNVTKVVNWYKSLQSQESSINGWTVQIVSTRDRREMEQAREKFRMNFPQYRIRNDYVEPYYRLRVGSFINKLDALALRNEMRRKYPAALHINQKLRKEDFY